MTADSVEDFFESLRKKIRRVLKELGYPSDITIVDTMGHRGRRLNQEGLDQLRQLREDAEEKFFDCGFSLKPGGRVMFVDGREFSSSAMRKATLQLLLQARGYPVPLDVMCNHLGVAETNIREYCFYLNQELAAFVKDSPCELLGPLINPIFGSYRIVADNFKLFQPVDRLSSFDNFIQSLAVESRPLIHLVR